MSVERVDPRELYRLRRVLLAAERRSILAQLASNRARSLLLGIERKYGLLGSEAKLDIATGRITREEMGQGGV